MDAVLDDLDAHVDGNDHFEFFWVPHTGWALTKTNNRTTEPLAPRGRVTEWWNDLFLQNYAFGALCRIGRLRPQWIPRLAKALPAAGRVTYVDQSYRVFASPRLVRFYEMEYAIPRAACSEALGRIRRFVEESGLLLNFPVEVRFTAADDIPLSTASGRESCYLAIHVFEGMELPPLLRGRRADHGRLRRASPLGQAPLPDRGHAGAAATTSGTGSSPSATASIRSGGSATTTWTRVLGR